MAVQFPSAPSDGQSVSVSGTNYVWSAAQSRWNSNLTFDLSAVSSDILPDADSSRSLGSTAKKWKALHLSANTLFLGDSGSISAGAGGGIEMGSLKIGSGEGAVELTASADGKLATKGTDASGNTEAAASEAGAASSVTAMTDLVALTGMTTGQTALVTSLNRIFMYTGTGWFKIADMTNESPTAITGVDGTYALEKDGTASVITAVSTDPEGFPLTWSYAVTTGSLGSTATVSQADNVFTVTPSTTEADAGEFSITFSVTDGTTGAVNATSAFTLSFGLSFPGAAVEYSFFNAGNLQAYYGMSGVMGSVSNFGTDYYPVATPRESAPLDGSGNSTGSTLTYAGVVHVFNTDGTHKFVVTDPNPDQSAPNTGRFFGYSVASNNTYLAVGHPESNQTSSGDGQTYVFNMSDGSLAYTLAPTNTTGTSCAGASVAMDNNFLASCGIKDCNVWRLDTGALVGTISNAMSNVGGTPNRDQIGMMQMNNGKLIIGDRKYADYRGQVKIYDVTNSGVTLSRTQDYLDAIPGGVPAAYVNSHQPNYGQTVGISPDGTKYFISMCWDTYWGQGLNVQVADKIGQRRVYIYNMSDGSDVNTIWNHRDLALTFPALATAGGGSSHTMGWGYYKGSVTITNDELIVGNDYYGSSGTSGNQIGDSTIGTVWVYKISDNSLLQTIDHPTNTTSTGNWGLDVRVNSDGSKLLIKSQTDYILYG